MVGIIVLWNFHTECGIVHGSYPMLILLKLKISLELTKYVYTCKLLELLAEKINNTNCHICILNYWICNTGGVIKAFNITRCDNTIQCSTYTYIFSNSTLPSNGRVHQYSYQFMGSLNQSFLVPLPSK